jgi:putative transposase
MVCSNLIEGMKVTAPNQVWVLDLTYIPMKCGHMYLTAIIDLYSLFIVGW